MWAVLASSPDVWRLDKQKPATSGLFCVLQICYSKGRELCWTSLALIIPSPELRGEPYPNDRAKKREPDGGVDSAQSIANARRVGGAECAPTRAIAQSAAIRNQRTSESEIDDDEIFLAHIAQRAAPVGGNVGETGAGREAFVGQPFRFVVDPPANQADPALVFGYFAHVALGKMEIR